MGFTFRGEISSSKSIFNRLLIAQSFSDRIQIRGITQSEDVLYLQKALRDFKHGEKEFFCGDGGTTFRFLAARVSKTPGEYRLTGSEQLFSRPIKEMLQFFDQVGVRHSLSGTSLDIKTDGWRIPDQIVCASTQTSQFLSAIALSAWNLDRDLRVLMSRSIASRGYLEMTLKILEQCGCKSIIQEASAASDPVLIIKAGQQPMATVLNVEQDMSSLFALAACAVLAGEIEIKNVPIESLQPDSIFFDHFRRMKLVYEMSEKTFFIRKQDITRGLDADVSNSPDLFPVLAVLCAKAKGYSTLTGVQNLKHKESDRLKNVLELLHRIGRRVDTIDNGVMIHGRGEEFSATGDFNPQGDHRMAMAAQVANFGGAKLNILDKSVTNKSFPEFWEILEGVAI